MFRQNNIEQKIEWEIIRILSLSTVYNDAKMRKYKRFVIELNRIEIDFEWRGRRNSDEIRLRNVMIHTNLTDEQVLEELKRFNPLRTNKPNLRRSI